MTLRRRRVLIGLGASLMVVGLAAMAFGVTVNHREENRAAAELVAARTDLDPEHAITIVGRWQSSGRLEPGSELGVAAGLALAAAAERLTDRPRARIVLGAAKRLVGHADGGLAASRIQSTLDGLPP